MKLLHEFGAKTCAEELAACRPASGSTKVEHC
jgi:hypothetical protein